LLELDHVSRAFGGTRALRDISFELRAGEVHVLAGENGAGKSTLIRIVAGADREFSGSFRLGERLVRFRDPSEARAAGIATIHQELSLVSTLTVADNFMLTSPGGMFSRWQRHAARERALRGLARVGVTLDPEAPVETLSLAERQLVEIARAVVDQPRVLVMDEPTSSLAAPEVAHLLELVRALARSGIGVIYVSHRLPEIFAIGDRITVLRDGARVLTETTTLLGSAGLVHAMIGRDSAAMRRAPERRERPARLRVAGLESTSRPPLAELAFEVGRGEIVGIAGVEGSGASRVLEVLFGTTPLTRGSMELDGVPYAPQNPRDAFARGVAFVASDRHASVLAGRSVLENATLSSLARFSPKAVVRPEREREAVAPGAQRLKLKAPSLESEVGTLSGGNQQKVALLRCLMAEPNLLLLDDPTRGIDLGARADVYTLLREIARAGTSVVFRSSDLAELVELADRVLVMFAGRLVATLDGSELEETQLLASMMGGGA
jgi:ribose transport system ATP-binding protein